MITFDVVSDRAAAGYSSHLNNRFDCLKRRIDSGVYSLSEILDNVAQDFYYYCGMLKVLDLIYPAEFLKRDVLAHRLDDLHNQFEDEIIQYYSSLFPSSSEEVKQ